MKLWYRLSRLVIVSLLTTTSALAADPATNSQSSSNVGEQGGNLVMEPGANSNKGGMTGTMTGPITLPKQEAPSASVPPLSGNISTQDPKAVGNMPQSDLGQSTLGGDDESSVQLNPNQIATGTRDMGSQPPPPSN